MNDVVILGVGMTKCGKFVDRSLHDMAKIAVTGALALFHEAYKAAQLNRHPLSAAHAYYLATRGSAAAMHLEDKVGSIAPGKIANFTVLDEDPYAVPPEKLKDIPVWGTVFEGKAYPLPKGRKRG